MQRPIREFANRNGLYFDTIGPRKARRGRKLTWTDINGCGHDLDFVIERGGTEETIGEPVAFIELAWRRYTRHSKNKVQEIAGALNPICEKYKMSKPFKGAILSGQFTESAIKQLKSEGFHVLYIPFERLVNAFRTHGLDIYFNEETTETDIRKKHTSLSKKAVIPQLEKVREEILKTCKDDIDLFVFELSQSYNRKIKTISILPLHGRRTEVNDVDNAIDFINNCENIPADNRLEYIEVIVTYNNGTFIQCQFKEKEEAVEFLGRIK